MRQVYPPRRALLFALRRYLLLTALLACLPLARTAPAHFQALIPSSDIVSAGDEKTIDLDILFTHPMEQGPVMEMGVPARFGVMVGGEQQDLSDSLQPRELEGKAAYECTYKVGPPGDYVFFLEPAPYWEPAEQKMIIHYTKVVVDVMGAEEGWDQMVGFPVEIEPLTRPYGLWTGNVFRGIVRKDGAPVPFAEVEVEYWNEGGLVTPPADPFITQVIKADAAGVFCYAMPRAGWWGFAALVDGEESPREGTSADESPEGQPADVELGGLMWVKTVDME